MTKQADCDRLRAERDAARAENAELHARLNAAGVAAARLGVLTLRAAQERDALRTAIEGALSLAEECPSCGGSGVASYGDACGHCGGGGEHCEIGPELHTLRAALAAVAQAERP